MTIAEDKTRPAAVFLKCVLKQVPQEGSILLNFLGMNGMLSNSGDKHAFCCKVLLNLMVDKCLREGMHFNFGFSSWSK